MAPAEWNAMFDLFHAAREKSGSERVMLLDAACGENTLLRKAVEELLKEDETAGGFLSKPLLGSLGGECRTSRIAPGQRLAATKSSTFTYRSLRNRMFSGLTSQ